MTVAAIIPCYRVSAQIEAVLRAMPPLVDAVYVVDDCCPEGSGKVAEAVAAGDSRIRVIRHGANQGVGGAMVTGYRAALADGHRVMVKVDGDGQMDPADLPRLAEPVLAGRADYAKGNRFRDFRALKSMPRLRLFGNSALSFLVKAASGYWTLMDPTNGYTAIHRDVLERVELEALEKRYFFECDMLMRLYLADAVVEDVALPARYGDETSSLSVRRAVLEFPGKLAGGFLRRVGMRYFIQDFNMASVYLLLGLPMVLFGIVVGAVEWAVSVDTGVVRSAGTVMLVAMPIILGLQLLLQAVAIDIASVPRRRT